MKYFIHTNPALIMSGAILLFSCTENCNTAPEGCNNNTFPNAEEWKKSDGGNGHLYEAVLDGGDITWEEAQEIALLRGDGWHLATITTEAENDFVRSLFQHNSDFFNCCVSQVASGPWIGASSSTNASNDWTWITGEPFGFVQWGPREPFGNGDHISFAQFGPTNQVGWNDIPSGYPNSPRSYILECSLIDNLIWK